MSRGGGEASVNGAVFLEPQAVQEMKLVCAQAPRARPQWTKLECFSTILTAHIYTAHICPAKAATEQQQESSGPHSTTVLYPDSDGEHARRNALFVDF